MNVGVIWVRDSINVGDDIQTIAISELVKSIEPQANVILFDRESLGSADFQTLSYLIVTGWFLKKPEGFPDSFQNVKPLFISFHLTSSNGVPGKVLNDDRRELWRLHQPIGCRDRGTMRSFQAAGIDAYFSACATLTLQPRTTSGTREPYVLIADPFYYASKGNYERHQVSRLLGKNFPWQVKEVANTDLARPGKPVEQRMKEAQTLLDQVSNAQFVITSRIHIALPALAMGTNVVFIHAGYDRNAHHDNDRFDGILELFHVVPGNHFWASSRKPIGKLIRATGVYKLQKSDISHLIPESFMSSGSHNKSSEGRFYADNIRKRVAAYLRSEEHKAI